MTERILSFYEPLADYYHLIFDDWNEAIERQAKILNPLLATQMHSHPLKILDCACGIGTQALGLAGFGHQVTASDLSRAEVNRAMHEAERLALNISFHISDMTSLAEIKDRDFDVVAALDNALPHLTADQLSRAVGAMGSKLKSNGLFLASIRDYDALILERPAAQKPAFYGGEGDRRIIHQVWDWIDAARYTLHLYITMQSEQKWTTHHFVSEYRCLLRNELSTVLQSSGFREVRWFMPAESGFYQPLVLAKRV
ncbi:MAG TPA: class I SAM-dependent methyltransferase [Edaphobacter sp.]|nr:class I SAM-dependent methyltransferase [Edaphobacter sp.]